MHRNVVCTSIPVTAGAEIKRLRFRLGAPNQCQRMTAGRKGCIETRMQGVESGSCHGFYSSFAMQAAALQ